MRFSSYAVFSSCCELVSYRSYINDLKSMYPDLRHYYAFQAWYDMYTVVYSIICCFILYKILQLEVCFLFRSVLFKCQCVTDPAFASTDEGARGKRPTHQAAKTQESASTKKHEGWANQMFCTSCKLSLNKLSILRDYPPLWNKSIKQRRILLFLLSWFKLINEF